MRVQARQPALRNMVLFWLIAPALAMAQTYSISGTVTDTAAHEVPSATVSAKSVKTGKTITARTDANGAFAIRDLAPGDYEVSAVAGELHARAVRVTVTIAQTTNLVVSPSPTRQLKARTKK